MTNQEQKPRKWGLIIFGAITGLLILICVIVAVNVNNGAIEKKNAVDGQIDVVEAFFDKSYKTMAQGAQIADRNLDKSKDAYKEIYVAMMEERYKDGEAGFMKWVQESNPEFDLTATSALYEKLMNSVESNREDFFLEQKKLVSMDKAYKTYCERWPNSWIVDYEKPDYVIISSDHTKQVMETGVDNNIDLFND